MIAELRESDIWVVQIGYDTCLGYTTSYGDAVHLGLGKDICNSNARIRHTKGLIAILPDGSKYILGPKVKVYRKFPPIVPFLRTTRKHRIRSGFKR